jgi:biopolymer transport protein ExbD
MRRQQAGYGKIPEINLNPMLNVMMGILAFFVLISATLSAEKGVDIALTGGKNQPPSAANEELPDPLIVSLTLPDNILLNGKPSTRAAVLAQVKTYLQANPKGAALLQADRNIQYEKVVDLLGDMQAVGGSRVSLAIDSDTGNAGNAPSSSAPSGSASGSSTQSPAQPQQAGASEGNQQPDSTGAQRETIQPVDEPKPGVTIPEVPEDYDS